MQIASNRCPPKNYRTTVEAIANYHLVNIKHHLFSYKQDIDLTKLIALTHSQ
ncbi:hypothetical protein [Nostoc sp.]|uniref:hypothetical protein n=1 Tax=Nostoc sp. TaxID=1180 RepID=UPI002FF64EEA